MCAMLPAAGNLQRWNAAGIDELSCNIFHTECNNNKYILYGDIRYYHAVEYQSDRKGEAD